MFAVILNKSSAFFLLSTPSVVSRMAAAPVAPPAVAVIPKKHVILACTGSVASIKVPELAKKLAERYEVRVVATQRALTFFTKAELGEIALYTDDDEWKAWTKRGDPVMHIDLRNWADLMLIAPLGANTLAKIAGGLCDNLLTCIVRAWKIGKKPVLFAPAMNTAMYEHPFTNIHVQILVDREKLSFVQIHPIVKKLMCGEEGNGAMAEVEIIYRSVQDYL